MYGEKYFSSEIMQTIRREPSSRPLFFLEKIYIRSMQVVSTFLLYFGKPQLGHTTKTNSITFQTVDLEICSILIFYKRSGTTFFTIFCMRFFKIKNFSFHILLTDQISLSGSLYFLRYWTVYVL